MLLPERTWTALLWRKQSNYMGLRRNRDWLKAISEHVKIVATVDDSQDLIDNRC